MKNNIALASFIAVLILAAILVSSYLPVIVMTAGKIVLGVLFGAVVYLIVWASMPLFRRTYAAWATQVDKVSHKFDSVMDSFVDDGF